MTVGDQGSPALLAPTKFLPAGLSFPICDTGIWAWPEELPGLTLLQPVVCVCGGGLAVAVGGLGVGKGEPQGVRRAREVLPAAP